ncbi:MAG TPA: alpha/beta hydrolase [Polyangia bacterium]
MKTVAAAGLAALVALGGSSPRATAAPTDRAAYASVNGLRLYYEEHGSGPPLVLLHGGGSTVQTSFGAIIPELARTHHVIAPEQQAHGHSGDRDRPLSFEQMTDDTAALLAQLGVVQADVLGFSNGGVVALQLAIRHRRLVRRLVVCSHRARPGTGPREVRQDGGADGVLPRPPRGSDSHHRGTDTGDGRRP